MPTGGRAALLFLLLWGEPLLSATQGVLTPGSSQEGEKFFEARIRPVLAAKCYSCHSAEAKKLQGKFRLDTREGLLRGGESGVVIVPGEPDKSRLIQAVRYTDEVLQMPPKESDRLSPEQVADFEAWVKMGAPDPRGGPAPKTTIAVDLKEASKLWSLRPPSEPKLPVVRNKRWAWGPVDQFVLAKLEEKALKPVGDADKRTLIRRATFDLIGLPPTPEEIDAFLADHSEDAFSKVVDRLLSSPRYGERWGRHWLDVVRYADTAGDNSDYPVPQLYRYRDFVIQSFNEDKPYDQFLREQIAGDLMPSDNEEEAHRRLIATGYIALARRFGSQIKDYPQHLTIEDTIDNLGKSVLGLSIACARCHDHKFDPISSEDYYALYGIFSSTRYPFPGIELDKAQRDLVPLIAHEKADAILRPFKEQLQALDKDLEALETQKTAAEKAVKDTEAALKAASAGREETKKPEEAKASEKSDEARLEERALGLMKAADKKKLEELRAALVRTTKKMQPLEAERKRLKAEEKALLEAILRSAPEDTQQDRLVEARRRVNELNYALKEARKNREEFAKHAPAIEAAYAVVDGPKIGNAKLQVRGEPKNPGKEVPRRFLQVLGGQVLPLDEKGSGRLELASWLTDPANPLTARVLVNRIWAGHFGTGIVQTPNDFGTRGMAPTHPELLDFLALRFVEKRWSVKAMHRLIMLSRTYQLASSGLAQTAAKDPSNTYLSRFSRHRLEAEEIRDSMLAVAGNLDVSMGGGHPFPAPAQWDFTQHRPFTAVYDTNKRSVYLMTPRIRKHPLFAVFDGPDPNASTPQRSVSTTPLQALFLLNDPFVHEQARKFTARLIGACSDDHKRMELAFTLALGRPPGAEEIKAGDAFLSALREKLKGTKAPADQHDGMVWESYARVVFGLNEFVYVD